MKEAVFSRHSVRKYTDKKLPGEVIEKLNGLIEEYNAEGGLSIRLVTDEPKSFSGFMAHYGGFSGVANYFAMIGAPKEDLDELIGYYGEKLVLASQEMGLNTCWVALTYSKRPVAMERGEKLLCVISVGYGENQGKPHRSKPLSSLCRCEGEMPEWFRRGMEFVCQAPTAMNQQRFLFTLSGGKVNARSKGGSCAKIDLGIAKLHFELGAGKENFEWA